MALIKCPECGQEVSDKAANCPKCAYPISSTRLDGKVRIKIGRHPTAPTTVRILKMKSGRELARGKSSSVIEFEVDEPTEIGFYQDGNTLNCKATVDASNGGRYSVDWGAGIFLPRMESCTKVDVFDSD